MIKRLQEQQVTQELLETFQLYNPFSPGPAELGTRCSSVSELLQLLEQQPYFSSSPTC